jgi:hypothetical protein
MATLAEFFSRSILAENRGKASGNTLYFLAIK